MNVLGVTMYRYRREAIERWRGDCLVGLEASTDDNGAWTDLTAQQEGGRLLVTIAALAGEPSVMTFAYRSPRLRMQSRLLRPQTGEYETVRVGALADERIIVPGRELIATRYRSSGATNHIDIRYSPQQEWIGVDSVVRGGRHLHYRLAS